MALSKIGSNQIDTAATPTVAGATVTGNLDVDGTTTVDGLTSSEAVKVADGTESAPSIVFNSDTNTGIYKKANDKLAFVTGGTERMRITDLGRIEFEVPTNQSGGLQDQRLDWRNENNAGIMASIAVHREADANAPAALVFRTSVDVDSASNSSDGEIAEKMRISSQGYVTMPNQPSFMARRSGSTQTSGTVVFNQVVHNVGNHYSTTTGGFTAPVGGRYLFAAVGMAQDNYFRGQILKNGSGMTQFRTDHDGATGLNYAQATITVIFELAANDIIKVHIDAGNFGGNTAEVQFFGQLLS